MSIELGVDVRLDRPMRHELAQVGDTTVAINVDDIRTGSQEIWYQGINSGVLVDFVRELHLTQAKGLEDHSITGSIQLVGVAVASLAQIPNRSILITVHVVNLVHTIAIDVQFAVPGVASARRKKRVQARRRRTCADATGLRSGVSHTDVALSPVVEGLRLP